MRITVELTLPVEVEVTVGLSPTSPELALSDAKVITEVDIDKHNLLENVSHEEQTKMLFDFLKEKGELLHLVRPGTGKALCKVDSVYLGMPMAGYRTSVEPWCPECHAELTRIFDASDAYDARVAAEKPKNEEKDVSCSDDHHNAGSDHGG